ncbi:MAG: hypothetical protein RLZZ515_2488 [Cyanobacteriota bacterium]
MELFKATVFGSALLMATAVQAQAEIDPKLHQLCVDARDYTGCIQSNQDGEGSANTLSLNPCPAVHAYSGAGYCTQVILSWQAKRTNVREQVCCHETDHSLGALTP